MICHNCGAEMVKKIEDDTYVIDGKEISIKNIEIQRCPNCQEGILTSEDAKRIENILNKYR